VATAASAVALLLLSYSFTVDTRWLRAASRSAGGPGEPEASPA
jgi:hypothetical protein